MPSFKDQYEQYFGPRKPYEPLDPKGFIDRTNKRALDIQGSVPSASPAYKPKIPNRALNLGEQEPEQGAVSGLLKTGTAMLGEGLLGAAEYGLDKVGLESAADVVQSGRASIEAWRESVYEKMSDEVLDLKGREFLTLDPQKTIWKGSPLDVGASIMYKLVEQVPMTLATLVPGGLMMRAGAKGAIGYLSASEAGLSVGFINNEIKAGIAEMSDDELASESPRFAQLLSQYGSEQARNMYEAEVTGVAPLIGGLVVGAIGAAAGRYLEPVLLPDAAKAGGLSFGRRVGRGAISEGLLQEAPQEATEQMASNAARAAYDGDVQLLDGVAEAAVQGAVVGGPMGGIFAGLAGRGAPPEPPVEDDTTPVERDVPDPDARKDVTIPETDLFGGKVISVDNRDPNAPRDRALTLDEEYDVIGIGRDRASQQFMDMGASQATLYESIIRDIRKIPVKDRTEDQKQKLKAAKKYIEDYGERAAAQKARMNDLTPRYGLAPDLEAAAVAASRGLRFKTRGGQTQTSAIPTQQYGEQDYQDMGIRGVGKGTPAFEDTQQQFDFPEPKQPVQPLAPGEPSTQMLLPGTEELPPTPVQQGQILRSSEGSGRKKIVVPGQRPAQAYVEERDAGQQRQDRRAQKAAEPAPREPVVTDDVTLRQFDSEGNLLQEKVVSSFNVDKLQQEWESKANKGMTVRSRPLLQTMSLEAAETQYAEAGVDVADITVVEKVRGKEILDTRVVFNKKQEEEAVKEFAPGPKTKYEVVGREETAARKAREEDRMDAVDREAPISAATSQERQPDLFAKEPEIIPQKRDLKIRRVGPRVRVMDGDSVLWEKVFGRAAEAEQAVKELTDQLELTPQVGGVEGISIWQDKGDVRRKPVPQTRGRLDTQREAKEASKRVTRSVREKVGPKLKEEGLIGKAIQDVTKGAKTTEEVVDRLLNEGARQELKRRRGRVAGIMNPDQIEFTDADAEQRYKEAFELAVDAELRKSLKEKLSGADRAEVISAAQKDIKKAQKMVADLRSRIGKPRWSTKKNKYFAAANKISKSRVQQKVEQQVEKKLGKKTADIQEIIKATQTQQAQRQIDIQEEAYGSTEYDIAEAEQVLKVTEAADEALGTREPEVDEVIEVEAGFDTSLTVEYLNRLYKDKSIDTQDLIDMVEAAVLYQMSSRHAQRADRQEQSLKTLQKARDGELSPSEMIKFIGRAANSARNQSTSEGRSRKKTLVLPTKGGRFVAFNTEGLTAASYKEESKADKIKRVNGAVKARKSIASNTAKLEERLLDETIQIDSVEVGPNETAPTEKGIEQMLAVQYLQELVTLARTIEQIGSNDPNMARLLNALDAAMQEAANFKVEQLSGKWSNAAIKQAAISLKGESLAAYLNKEWTGLKAVNELNGVKVKGTFDTREEAELHRAKVFRMKGGRMLVAKIEKTKVPKTKGKYVYDVSFRRQRKLTEMLNLARLTAQIRTWRKSTDFETFVWPMIQRMVAAKYSRAGVYSPTVAEAATLDHLLKMWDRNPEFKGLRQLLRNVGYIPFDKKGNVILDTENRSDGRISLNLPESFDTRERYGSDLRKEDELERRPMPSFDFELKRPSKDLFGNRIPWNKKLPYQTDPEAAPDPDTLVEVKRTRYRTRRGTWRSSSIMEQKPEIDETLYSGEEMFTEENMQSVYQASPTDIKALQTFRKFRKIVDNSKSTISALVDAEEKLIATLKELGLVTRFANFAGLVHITLPNGQKVTYRRSANELANGDISKKTAKGRMRAITKKMTQGTAAQRRYLAENKDMGDFDLPMFDDSYEYSYDLRNYQNAKRLANENVQEAVRRVGNLLLDSKNPPDINQLLDEITDSAEGTLAMAAAKLRAVALRNVKVKWSDREAKNLGHYDPNTATIYLNRNSLGKLRDNMDPALAAKAVHTLLHETAHAATIAALRTNAVLRGSMNTLRSVMQKKWNPISYSAAVDNATAEEWASMAYGLKDVEEFVAEMFGNEKFQQLAAMTDVREGLERSSVWEKFKTMLRVVLGFEGPVEGSVFDMVMALSDKLFQFAGEKVEGDIVDLSLKDSWVGKAAAQGWDRLDSSLNLEQTVRDQIFQRGERGKFVDKLTSFAQLVRRFGDRLPGLTNYYKAFKLRNAMNSELMQLPEKISRRWTELQEAQPEMAVKLSRLMTRASLYQIDPTNAMSHSRNAAVKGSKQTKLYNELRSEYKSLSPEALNIWNRASGYYATALRQESALLMLNALRATVDMDTATFDKKYNEDNILKFADKEKMKEEFGDAVTDLNVATIAKLSALPELKRGVYFPLTRYGEYAVDAQTIIKTRSFSDKKKAQEFAGKYKADDPTYQVGLYREGDQWVVKVIDREFHLFESASQARTEAARLRQMFDDVSINHKYKRQMEAAIGSNEALQSVLGALSNNPAAQAAIKNFYLRNLADTSFRKKQINRKQVKGVPEVSQHRNFANYAKQSSYYTAQLKYGWQMAEAITKMKDYLRKEFRGEDSEALRLGQVLKSVEERDQLSEDLQAVNPAVRGLLGATQFWMLTSASYHMINSSQPWMVTLPVLAAKHGFAKAFGALRKGQSLTWQPISQEAWASRFGAKAVTSKAAAEQAFDVYDEVKASIRKNAGANAEKYIVMLDELKKNHVLEISPMTELREVAGGDTGLSSRVLDASRIMAHLVEINNRVLTAIAAYDLEMAATGNDEAAQAYAAEMVETTQFDYSTANKPPLFQQLPLMFQFMQWSQHIYALLISNMVRAVKGGAVDKQTARRAVFGLLGSHAMVGGVLGVTLQPIKLAFGLAALAFADDDDPITAADAITGEWFDREVTAGLSSVMGSDLAMIFSRGLGMAIGTDLSVRMSMGTLYFVDLRTENPQQVIGSLVSSFGGAPLSQVMQWGSAGVKMYNGEWQKGIEQAAPKLFRDMLRAGRYASEGLVNNAGDVVVPDKDISPWQLALQFAGFAPAETSKFYAGQAAIKFEENFVRNRRSELLKQFRTAATPREKLEARKAIRDFNKRWRYVRIKPSALESTVKSKRERERGYEKYGAGLDRRAARQFARAGEPYR